MERCVIHLLGASGSGTSTLGRFIAGQMDSFFMDTDDYYWMTTDPQYTTSRPISERLALMRRDIATQKKVVISGSLVDWGDELIPLFTLAIRVETATAVRIARLRARERVRFGSRLDPDGDMYAHHEKFIRWASDYDDGDVHMRSRAMHDHWQKQLACPLVTVDGNLPVEANWEMIKSYL